MTKEQEDYINWLRSEENNRAVMHTLEGLKSAYSKMTYEDFLTLLGGRDDTYWQEHWLIFTKIARDIGKLGTFFPILVNHGHELRKETSR